MSASFNELIPLCLHASVAVGTTGDKVTFTIPFKCEVRRLWAAVEGTSSHATGFVLKFDKRPTAGSDTSRGDGDVGVLTKPASVNHQGKLLYEDPTTKVTLDEGDQVVAEVTTANGDALNIVPGLLLERIPEDPANNTAMIAA